MAVLCDKIELRGWAPGLMKKGEAWKAPRNSLRQAINVVLRNGSLEPLKALGAAETTGLGAGTWAWIWKLGSTWLGHTTARFAVEWESAYLAYVTVGATPPQWTNGTTTENLGIARPTTACTMAAGGAGNITQTGITYVYTYYTALGQESGPSEPSTAVTLTAQKASLTGILNGPAGTAGKYVYRVLNGTYLKVLTIADNTTTTGEDNLTRVQLEACDPLLTEDYGPAPNLEGLCVKARQGKLAGWIGNEWWDSAGGAPGAWSQDSFIFEEPIVACTGTGPYWLVLTAARPYYISGDDWDNYARRPFTNTYGCSAARTLVECDGAFLWWSPRGIIRHVPGGGFDQLMVNAFDDTDIAGYSTSGMHASYVDGYYLLHHSGGTLICDVQSGTVFTESDQTAGATYRANDGTLYLASGNDVKEWAAGAANRTMTIQTAEWAAEGLSDVFYIHGARVFGAGTFTPSWYRDGSLFSTPDPLSLSTRGKNFWAARGLMGGGSLYFTCTDTVTGIDINPEVR